MSAIKALEVMRMKCIPIVFVLAIVLSACSVTRNATLVEFDTGEVLNAQFTDSNATGGNLTVTMPSGEVLRGRYSGVRGTDEITFTEATASAYGHAGGEYFYGTISGVGQRRTVGGQGKAYGLLTSTTLGSTLVMEIIAIYNVLDGHGFGEARTNDGRRYKVQF